VNIYLVGGAVRDKYLNLEVKERDWVVTGATPEEMLAQGFRQVGKDFPVFLHPDTHEEYALARTERKISLGYKGFDTFFDPNVSLKEDLKRRDLTINAMAQNANGELIDPFHGLNDIQNKILRHVSPAFVEDPVRILRLARFASRFAGLGFKIANETKDLMRQIVEKGEVDALVPDRVWKEVSRTLFEPQPLQFFQVLKDCYALPRLFPELVDNFNKAMSALHQAVDFTDKPILRWAALCSESSLVQLQALHQRLPLPREYFELTQLVANYCPSLKTKLTAEESLQLLEKVDAFRRIERFEDFLSICEILKINISDFKRNYQLAQSVKAQDLISQGIQGAAIKQALFNARLQKIVMSQERC
jgi:tRNA nucleotidyltransferase (CCA-adding enzyme)